MRKTISINRKKEANKGITLIALVITIIILLILAGISIATLTGENGILGKASTAKEETAIKGYEEQLNLIWQGVKAENVDTNVTHEQLLEQCKSKIEKDSNFEGARVTIIDNIIEVITKEGYIFHIIDGKAEYVGNDGEEKGPVTANLTASELKDKKLTFTATAEGASGRKLTYIFYVNGEEKQRTTTYKTTFTSNEYTTHFEEIVTARVEIEYGGESPSTSNEVTVEDNTIASKEELKSFRDKVNGGKDYSGKTVKVANYIDLQGSQTDQWTPIGNATNNFKGTFDGNYNTIDNLYINIANGDDQGLFGVISNAIIQNTIVENVNITATTSTFVGGIVGKCEASEIMRCGISGEVRGYEHVGRNSWILWRLCGGEGGN